MCVLYCWWLRNDEPFVGGTRRQTDPRPLLSIQFQDFRDTQRLILPGRESQRKRSHLLFTCTGGSTRRTSLVSWWKQHKTHWNQLFIRFTKRQRNGATHILHEIWMLMPLMSLKFVYLIRKYMKHDQHRIIDFYIKHIINTVNEPLNQSINQF